MDKKVIGFIRVTTNDGRTWFGELLEGDNIKAEVRSALEQFGNDSEVYAEEFTHHEGNEDDPYYDPYDIYGDNYNDYEVRL